MKKVLIAVGVLLSILLLSAFISYNMDPVPFKFGLFVMEPWVLSWPLWMVLMGTFLLGFLLSTLLGVWSSVAVRVEVSKLRKQNASLTKEVAALRNLPLQGDSASSGAASKG